LRRGPFRAPVVLDTGFVSLELVDPIPIEDGFSADPLRFGEAVHAAHEVAAAMGIATQLTHAKVYKRGPDGRLRLVRFMLPVPGTQELRRPGVPNRPRQKFGRPRGRKAQKR
jgi:hypothetical protein